MESPSNIAQQQCCCGRPDCAYLQHNDMALGGLERDLATAARLGQALLTRHETYISDSQAEHARLSSYISELESERTSLQSANEKIVAENRDLLSRLESLNTSLSSSDVEVKRLEELLLDCELELKRLNGLVRRTEDLDGRVNDMERERVALNKQISEGRDEIRGTLARWRESERKVRELEEDMRRIEREGLAERKQHEEIMARIEKERVLERELGGAEGRLKGAAAVQSMRSNAPGSKNVVSHFVRDILHDNANLQAGIAELRELLQSSNEEVQNLREQVLLHQPVMDEESGHESQRAVSLNDELAQLEPSPKQVQQEVHVHHHYHAKIAKREKSLPARRPSRKRTTIPNHGYASDVSSPSTPISRSQRFTSSPVIPTSLHQPIPRRNNRWSMQSTATQSSIYSSMPSSPRSYFDRGGSLFDRIEQGEESSRPTSPESAVDIYSPDWKQQFRNDDFGLGVLAEDVLPTPESSLSAAQDTIEEEFPGNPIPALATEPPSHSLTPKPSIILESDSSGDHDITPRPPERRPPINDIDVIVSSDDPIHSPLDSIPEIRPSLTHRGSHESLVSISGMDIHLAQRPSAASTLQLLRGNSSHFALSPSQSHKLSTAAPLASVTEYTVLSSGFDAAPLASGKAIRRMPSGIEALSGIAVPAPRQRPVKTQSSGNGGITNLVGGWVRGKWGIAPVKSFAGLRSVSAEQALPAAKSSATNSSLSSRSSSILSTQTTLSTTESQNQSTTNENPESSQIATTSASMTTTKSPDQLSGLTTSTPLPSTSSTPKPILQPDHSNSSPVINMPLPKSRSISISRPTTVVAVQRFSDTDFTFLGRSPGVNQRGFIPGFRAAVLSKPTPSNVTGRVIDEDALREGLCE